MCERIKAQITAELWRHEYTRKDAITKREAAQAFVPTKETDEVIKIINEMGNNDDCPLAEDFEGIEYWPPHVALYHDPSWIIEYINDKDPDSLPFDLRDWDH